MMKLHYKGERISHVAALLCLRILLAEPECLCASCWHTCCPGRGLGCYFREGALSTGVGLCGLSQFGSKY